MELLELALEPRDVPGLLGQERVQAGLVLARGPNAFFSGDSSDSSVIPRRRGDPTPPA